MVQISLISVVLNVVLKVHLSIAHPEVHFFKVVTLSDLECDYLNAHACCAKLNKFVLPEVIFKAIPSILFLISGHWVVLLLNAPFVIWYVYKFVRQPVAHVSYFDPAEIHNRGELKAHMQTSLIRLGEHLVFFFVYLYWWVKQFKFVDNKYWSFLKFNFSLKVW